MPEPRYSDAAADLFGEHGIVPSRRPALAALIAFACQSPALDPTKYGNAADGLTSYQQDKNTASQQFEEFKEALNDAIVTGVRDEGIISASLLVNEHRLTWKEGQWDYTFSVFHPTEYRRAVCMVLEQAAQTVRQVRPPKSRRVTTIEELKDLNKENGSPWFHRSRMAFFGTQIHGGIIQGKYFVTSEQPPRGPRKYSVRTFNETGDVDTVGDFCGFDSESDALASIPSPKIRSPIISDLPKSEPKEWIRHIAVSAADLFGEHGIVPSRRPALAALIAFACEDPGLDPAAYGNAANAPAAREKDERTASQQLEEFKEALNDAISEGLTDEQLIAELVIPVKPDTSNEPGRFGRVLASMNPPGPRPEPSGPAWEATLKTLDQGWQDSPNNLSRLKWKEFPCGGWTYTAGPNYATSFRRTACVLIERAVQRLRASRPTQFRAVNTIDELKQLNAANGMSWFSRGALAFFATLIHGEIIQGKYFVTSEAWPLKAERKFTVRSFDEKGDVKGASELMAFNSLTEALAWIPRC